MKIRYLTGILVCSILLLFATVVWTVSVPDTEQTASYDTTGNMIIYPSQDQIIYSQGKNYSVVINEQGNLNNSSDNPAPENSTCADSTYGSITILEVNPVPGTKLTRGSQVAFSGIVRYTLTNTDSGSLVVGLLPEPRGLSCTSLVTIHRSDIVPTTEGIDVFFNGTVTIERIISTVCDEPTLLDSVKVTAFITPSGFTTSCIVAASTLYPVDGNITPSPTPVPVLSVTPSSKAVSKDAGITAFSVSNTGTGDMLWTAAVTSGDSWLEISSGVSGTNSGTINCSFTANISTSSRTATIRVTATGSPVDVTVKQMPTVCTATLDGNLLIHIPDLASLMDWWYAPAYWADFVYDYNPTYPALIIFKMTNLTMLPVYRPECVKEKSTYSDDFKIHIPGLLLADGITRLSVDMEYISGISTNGNTCFVVTKYEVVPD
jgi:hypothetical protein